MGDKPPQNLVSREWCKNGGRVIAYTEVNGFGIMVTTNGSYYKVGAKWMVWTFLVDVVSGKSEKELDTLSSEWWDRYSKAGRAGTTFGEPCPHRATACWKVGGWKTEYDKQVAKATEHEHI